MVGFVRTSVGALVVWGLLAWVGAAGAAAAGPVRSFDGVDDQLQLAATAGTNVTGAVTMAAIVRPDTTFGEHTVLSLQTSGGTGAGYGMLISGGGGVGIWNGSTGLDSSSGLLASSEWALVAVTKASGTATPRFHVYRFDLNSWTHANAGTTIGNGGSTAGGSIRIGSHENDYEFNGDIAATALFADNLSDGEVEDLIDSYDEWLDLDPAAMWLLNQEDLTHPVLDETDGGADEGPNSIGTAIINFDSPLSGDPNDTIFVGDYRAGDTDQWWGVQEVGPNASVTVANSSPTPPAGETHYGRFELQTGDERAEVYSGLRLYEGEDVYVRFLVRFEAGFPADPLAWGHLVWQLHQQGTTDSPPVALYVDGSSPGSFNLASNNHYWWIGPEIDPEEWHEFVVHVKHSENEEVGFVELWLDGEPQTMVNNEERIYGATLLDDFNYPKSGYYRDDSITGTGVVEIAGYRIARSLGALP